MEKLGTYMIKQLLRPILAKKCPPSMGLFGEQAEKANCYTLFLRSEGKRNIVIESIDGDTLYGKKHDEDGASTEMAITIDELESTGDIEILHVWRGYRISYKGLADFIIYGKTGIQYLKLGVHRILYKLWRYIYNRKRLVTVGRLELLRILVDNHIEQGGKEIGLIDLMTRLYSIAWVEHPDADSQEGKLSLYLDSLVESGELSKNKADYFVTAKAILTLQEFEEDERRHRNHVRLQVMMIILTGLLALFTIIQAGIIRVPCVLDLSKLFGLDTK
jgi:hypothetical protein